MLSGASSVAVIARPIWPNTDRTSGKLFMIRSVRCRVSRACVTLIPGYVVGMYSRSPSLSGGVNCVPRCDNGIQIETTAASVSGSRTHRRAIAARNTGENAPRNIRFTGLCDSSRIFCGNTSIAASIIHARLITALYRAKMPLPLLSRHSKTAGTMTIRILRPHRSHPGHCWENSRGLTR